jgi:competence protein ComEA
VIVPKRGEAAAAAPGGPGSGAAGGATTGAAPGGASGGAPVSLSTASQPQLETLEGIGPALAMRIIEFREKNGGFRSIEQLKEVSGIGEKRFEALRDSVRP